MLGAKALLFVPEKDLAALQQTLREYLPFIEQFTHTTNLVSLFDGVNTRFRTARRQSSEATDSLVKALPRWSELSRRPPRACAGPACAVSGHYGTFNASEEAEHESYIAFAKGRIYLVTA